MGGSISLGSAVYPVSTWSLNLSNDVQEVTDTASNGWKTVIAGISSGELSFTAFWGASVASLSTAFGLGTSVVANLAVGNNGEVFSGTFIISSDVVTNGAKTPVEFQCTAVLNGAITLPS